jgi:hypothetical protein
MAGVAGVGAVFASGRVRVRVLLLLLVRLRLSP